MDTLTALRDDFKLFLQALWSQLDLPSPTRAQYAIADYLQHGPKRLQIQACRGVGKSWITGAFVLWTLFNNPETDIGARASRAIVNEAKYFIINPLQKAFKNVFGNREI